jgi:hypothetical protein
MGDNDFTDSPRSHFRVDRVEARANLELLKSAQVPGTTAGHAELLIVSNCAPRQALEAEPFETGAIQRRFDQVVALRGGNEIAAAAGVIMNPGADNFALAEKAEEAGIEVVEDCTLVMLRTGQF